MDDELRNRYRVKRRDFNAPPMRRRPMPPQPTVMPPSRPAGDRPTDLNPHAETKPSNHHSRLPEETLPEPAPRPRPVRQKKRTKKLVIAIILLFIIAGGIAGGIYAKDHHKPAKAAAAAIPLPPAMISQVNYPIYFPSPLPAGYLYQTGSGIVQSGLVFFKLSSGNKTVFFTEQAKPAKPVNLDALPNFQKFSVPAGMAALGSSLSKPTGLVVTGSSLINVSSTGGATADDLKAIFSSLVAVPKSR
jgi:hypothetical protein